MCSIWNLGQINAVPAREFPDISPVYLSPHGLPAPGSFVLALTRHPCALKLVCAALAATRDNRPTKPKPARINSHWNRFWTQSSSHSRGQVSVSLHQLHHVLSRNLQFLLCRDSRSLPIGRSDAAAQALTRRGGPQVALQSRKSEHLPRTFFFLCDHES